MGQYLIHTDNGQTLFLEHHGIKGQRWGVRNGPPYPLSKNKDSSTSLSSDEQMAIENISKARTANMDKFGKDRDSNVCYIAGYSGSGKSTTALGLKRKNDKVIHLDGYSEIGMSQLHDKEFDAYLKSHGIGIHKLSFKENNGSSDYWKNVDSFREAIEQFSKEQFDKGNRVYVEGVQIPDQWLANNSWFNGKPIIILNTNSNQSLLRRSERDGIDVKEKGEEWFKEQLKNQKIMTAKLDDLANKTEAIENGKQYVNLVLNKYI